MKNRSLLLILLLLSSLLFAQASAESSMLNSDYYMATDANNRTLKLEKKPSHLLIAGKAGNMPANALFLFEEVQSMDLTLPKTDQGLGDFFAFIRPDLDQKPRISQTASAEEIASRNSDLVLMKATHFESTAKKLDQLGIPNYTMNLESYEDWKAELSELGKLLKNTSRAQQLIQLYETRVKFITDRVASLKPQDKKTVLLLQAERSDAAYAYKIAPDSWMQTWMVETAGAIPVWKGSNKAANGWSTVSFEQIAAWNPDLVILLSYKDASDIYLKAVQTSELWSLLDAFKQGNVKASPHDMMNYVQPVASWILGLQWLAKEAHPALFADVDMEYEVQRFYQEFYNIHDRAKLDVLLDLYRTSVASNTL